MRRVGKRGSRMLFTGLPGNGKNTRVCRVVDALSDLWPAGFTRRRFASEARGVDSGRSGWPRARCCSPTSRSPGATASAGTGSTSRVFARFLGGPDLAGARLIVIDEIGKMACFSARFVSFVETLLDGGQPVLATVALRGGGFIADVKRRADVEEVAVTAKDRDWVVGEVVRRVRVGERLTPRPLISPRTRRRAQREARAGRTGGTSDPSTTPPPSRRIDPEM